MNQESAGQAGSSADQGLPTESSGGNMPGGTTDGSAITAHQDHQDDIDNQILKWMGNRLDRHRADCAYTVPYDSRLGDKFLPQEHEYICEQIMKREPVGKYAKEITGTCPDRIYTGKITQRFIIRFFTNK